MNHSLEDFLDLLFGADHRTCYAPGPFETSVWPEPLGADLFFSINGLTGHRRDDNVREYRNILIEIDDMPLEEQIDYVTSRLPVSSIVFSGSKSYHFIISLQTPLGSREEYDALVKRIYLLLPHADRTCKNPSRFSRLPFRLRPDTGKHQQLIDLRDRVPNGLLESLLPATPPEAPRLKPGDAGFVPVNVQAAANFPNKTMNELGLARNGFFHWLGCRITDNNMTMFERRALVEHAYSMLENKKDFSLREAKNAARCK